MRAPVSSDPLPSDQPPTDQQRAEVVTSGLLREWPLPDPGQDKESRGRTLILGGSRSTPGAVLLAAEAALRAGAGKLQVATVASTAVQLGVALPEALVLGLRETADGTLDPAGADEVRGLVEGAAAVVMGPGMQGLDETTALVRSLLPAVRGRLVLDALAMAALTGDFDALGEVAGRTALTPNNKELALTLGEEPERVEQDVQAAVLRLAAATGAAVTSGAAHSVTATPDGRVWVDSAGGRGLGVSGSGDVLAGAVVGLAARGAPPEQAAVWGVHLHRRAGDRLAAQIGRVGFLARELPGEFPQVLLEIEV